MHQVPDHFRDADVRWTYAETATCTFTAPFDGLLKTRFSTTDPNPAGAFTAANPNFGGLAASSPPIPLAQLVIGVPLTKGAIVGLTAGDVAALDDEPVSDVLTFMPAALPVSPTSLFPAFTTTPPESVAIA